MTAIFEVFAITNNNREVSIYFGTNEKLARDTFDFYAREKKYFNLSMVVIMNDNELDRVYIEA